jgi:sugar phosphate isomerase/epimerase
MKTLRLLALLAVSFALSWNPAAAQTPPQLGLQTWTCRNMTFDQVVAFATKHGIKNIQFIKSHLDPSAPAAESLRKKAVLEQNGLTAYTFGVNGTSMDKEANRKLFEFAKLMGIKIIVVEPRNLAEWDNLEALVKEYDIKLAIHNHGKGSVYGDPATVQKILDARDRRIGVCLDIGWITAAGFGRGMLRLHRHHVGLFELAEAKHGARHAERREDVLLEEIRQRCLSDPLDDLCGEQDAHALVVILCARRKEQRRAHRAVHEC